MTTEEESRQRTRRRPEIRGQGVVVEYQERVDALRVPPEYIQPAVRRQATRDEVVDLQRVSCRQNRHVGEGLVWLVLLAYQQDGMVQMIHQFCNPFSVPPPSCPHRVTPEPIQMTGGSFRHERNGWTTSKQTASLLIEQGN